MEVSYGKKKEYLLIRVMSWIFLAVNAFLVVYWQEVIWRRDAYEAYAWIFQKGSLFLCSVFLVFLLTGGLFLATNNLFAAVLISNLLSFALNLINYFKYDLKGEVFQFVDLALYKEGLTILGDFSIYIAPCVIIGGVFCLFRVMIAWGMSRLTKVIRNRKVRIAECAAGICLCVIFFKAAPQFYYLAEETPVIYAAAEYYRDAGVMAGFFNTLPKKAEKPQNYGKALVEETISQAPFCVEETLYPDVIFIMEESFSDIASLEGVQLSADPLELFKERQERSISGKILSPTYGGNTCQAEFEVLTGYPSFLVSGNAYTDYINGSIDSLVSLYRGNGYETYAYHPNTGAFFNRNNVYRSMGFDHITFENDFALPTERLGGWTDDASLFDNIIYDYENRDESVPFFAFAVTTQNHGGYDWEFMQDAYIDVISASGGAEKEESALHTYANLCKYTDLSLDRFINYFEEKKNPTIIVVWGDHTPNYGFFGAQPVEETVNDLEKYRDYHTTPLLIWNNYNLRQEDVGYLSAYRLGAYVAALSGLNDPYFNLLTSAECPNAIYGLAVGQDGAVTETEQFEEGVREYLDKIWLVEYDRLFGRNYYADLAKT